MYKGEYLTGDFQTFTVYENGKIVAKRKTRKKVNIVIKLWKSYLKGGKGDYADMFTFSRNPEREKRDQNHPCLIREASWMGFNYLLMR